MAGLKNILSKKHWRFLVEWSILNLLGWAVGLFIVDQIYSFFDFIKPSALKTVFAWLPFGACIGILQWVKLREISIAFFKWTLTTALGFCVLATLCFWVGNIFSAEDRMIGLATLILAILFGAGIIGSLQSVVMKESISKPELWIMSYVFGLLLLLVVASIIYFQRSLLIKIYYSIDFLYNFSFELGFGFLSILTSLGISIPTGYILLKHSSFYSSTEKTG